MEKGKGLTCSDLFLLVFLPRMKRFSRRLERGLIIWIKARIYVDLKLDGRSLSVCPLSPFFTSLASSFSVAYLAHMKVSLPVGETPVGEEDWG